MLSPYLHHVHGLAAHSVPRLSSHVDTVSLTQHTNFPRELYLVQYLPHFLKYRTFLVVWFYPRVLPDLSTNLALPCGCHATEGRGVWVSSGATRAQFDFYQPVLDVWVYTQGYS